ncbi:MAG: hypothetical protein Tsb0015_10060 [Simkaniaceae bacterium]
MEKLLFKNTEYLGSFLDLSKIPPYFSSKKAEALPEIALIGRSNVGKSSLINHLLQNKIAYISSKPGKTQTLNFFVVDELLCFVDLPGYGFAKVPNNLKKKWGPALDKYLTNRHSLKLILLLLDSRRIPNEDDLKLIQFASFYKIPFLLVFTKYDKLSQSEKSSHNKLIKAWFEKNLKEEIPAIYYSIKEPNCRKILISQIKQFVREL